VHSIQVGGVGAVLIGAMVGGGRTGAEVGGDVGVTVGGQHTSPG